MVKRMKKQDEIGFVIFGATGDLTRRKLLPALYQLASENRLPEKLKIIGFARRPWTDAELRQVLAEGIEESERLSLGFTPGNFTDVKQALEYLFRMLNLKIEIKETDKSPAYFVDGRVAGVFLDGKSTKTTI